MKVGSAGELRLFLQQRVAAATQEVARLDPDHLLAENEDVLVAGIVSTFMPHPVTVDWDNPSRSPIRETSMQVRDAFDQRTFTVSASCVVISYPIEGTSQLLHYQASRGYMRLFDAEVNGASLDVEVVARDLTA